MMSKLWIYKALITGIVLPMQLQVTASDDAKLVKTVNRGFAVQPHSELEIHNKYGDIIVNHWGKDSVRLTVTVTAQGKDDPAAQALLDRTKINFHTTANGIEVYTDITKSDGWFRDFWNELSGYSQTILSKDQLTIDFQVYMPEKIDLEINNKYGDIFLSDRSGETRIDLSNGNLKAEAITGKAILSFQFANADIATLHEADMMLKSAELRLQQVQYLHLQCNSSTIEMGKVGSARLTSRTDKITVEKIDELSGKSSFTKLRLEEISGGLDLETNYGSVTLEKVGNRFSEIQIQGNSTDVDLTFDHMAYFNTKIIAKEGKYSLPPQHGLRQVYTDNSEKFIKSTGSLGKLNSHPGELDIHAHGGKVELEFAPFNPQSQIKH